MTSLNYLTSQTLQARRAQLAQAIVNHPAVQLPPDRTGAGDGGQHSPLRDADDLLAYLSTAIATNAPALFVDYTAWVKALFAGRQRPADALAKTLDTTRAVVRDQLPAEQAALAEDYLAIGLARLPDAPVTPPLFVRDDLPLGGLARDYLDALLHGDRISARQMILAALARGVSVKDLYLHVFQRTQYEIGRLWQINQISVAQEHFCTAATQVIMSQLYPQIFTTARVGRRLVATCVGGELHEMGVRMVADFFEMDGWDTYYLGANAQADTVIRALAERRAHVLAVSATITSHVALVAELIAAVRASAVGRSVKILVGGYPFRVSDGLWRTVKSDGFAHDAQQAVALAAELVAN